MWILLGRPLFCLPQTRTNQIRLTSWIRHFIPFVCFSCYLSVVYLLYPYSVTIYLLFPHLLTFYLLFIPTQLEFICCIPTNVQFFCSLSQFFNLSAFIMFLLLTYIFHKMDVMLLLLCVLFTFTSLFQYVYYMPAEIQLLQVVNEFLMPAKCRLSRCVILPLPPI